MTSFITSDLDLGGRYAVHFIVYHWFSPRYVV